MDAEELRELEEQEPRNMRARKYAAMQIARIGHYDSEKELQNQETQFRTYKRYDSYRANQASDALPFSAPKHSKATTKQRKRLDYATVTTSIKLPVPEVYWYRHNPAYYAAAYRAGHLTTGEWKEFVRNVLAMAEVGKRDRSWRNVPR